VHAEQFLDNARDPEAWRKHARALRRSGDAMWEQFSLDLVGAVVGSIDNRKREPNFDAALESLEITKLLYGLALETALKAWVVEHSPDKIQIRLVVDGNGNAVDAELKSIGVPTSSGHNLLALSEAAGLFGEAFSTVLRTDSDRRAMRNICRDLSEVVLWRGRYPVPLASAEPLKYDKGADPRATAHYVRDWLDPVLDVLLKVNATSAAPG
jgi:hypothetical protein